MSFPFSKLRALILCGLLTASLAATSRAQTAANGNFSAQEQAQTLVARGVEAFERGQIEQARLLLGNSLRLAETPESHFWMGRIHATRAQSSPDEKRLAVASFRRALEMQPYGEEGELTRGWLLRMDGRPKSVRFVAARWDGDGEESATRDLIENLALVARARGYKVNEPPRDQFEMTKISTEQLGQGCKDEIGALESGWLVCVSVESLESKYSQPEGKSDGGYRATGEAKIQIFDPLGNTLRAPRSVSDTSFSLTGFLGNPLRPSSSEAWQSAIVRLGDHIWDKCGVVFGGNRDSAMLDETTFPSQLAGVYGRAAVPYDSAVTLPLLALTACGLQDDAKGDDAVDAARNMTSELQSELLRPGGLAVITPGGMHAALTATGAPTESFAVGEVCAAARATGARYAMVSRLTYFDAKAKNMFIMTKVTVRVKLIVVLLDAQTQEPLLTRTYEEKQGVKKWLGGAGVGALIEKQNQALERVRKAAAKDILAIVTKPISI